MDSRPAIYRGVLIIRRRRECISCAGRMSTVEISEKSFDGMSQKNADKILGKMLENIGRRMGADEETETETET